MSRELETLNLLSHDPEEFEGKVISINGCDYIIGKFLGAGGDKIAHMLTNKQSGLCLHVIKFYITIDTAKEDSEITKEVTNQLKNAFIDSGEFGDIIPFEFSVTGYGGTFTIQEYAGSDEGANVTNEIMDRADKEMENGNFNQSLSLYQQVLEINPFHTAALNNLSCAQSKLGDLDASAESIDKALEVEPNYLTYHINYILSLKARGYLRMSLDHFEKIRVQFDFSHYDQLGVNISLQCGEPEKAKTLLQKSLLDEKKKKRLYSIIDEEISSKSRSLQVMKEARKNALSRQINTALDLMNKAYSIYDKDSTLVINLGLMLQRSGNYKKGDELLMSIWIKEVPSYLSILSLANAAFGEIRLSNFSLAIRLLDALMHSLPVADDENIASSDLPGIAQWVDHEFIEEEQPHTTHKLIMDAIKQFSKNERMPDSINKLVALYEQADEQFKST